ncbi:MAG: hypothetical protein HOV87_30400 [Catenulispora sp.]|nr:hypothetical protein [Catenulispora sp.]
MTFLAISLRTLLGVVFAVALGGKVRSRRSFADFAASLHELRWLPGPARAAAPVAVVAVEAASIVLLAVPATVPWGFGLTFLTLAVFTASVGWSLRRGETVRCRCFGTDSGPMGGWELARNGVLLVAAGAGLLASATGPASGAAAGSAVAAVAGALAAALIVRWDDLRFVFSSPTAGR